MRDRFGLGDNPVLEVVVRIHIESLPEGLFLATSEDVQGLIAQGRTVAETLEIARDVATKILEMRAENGDQPRLPKVQDSFDCSIVVEA